jgi:EmrB/QacA subfamily drug resistance transporter
MSSPTSESGGRTPAARTAALVLLVACLAQFMVVLDVAVVNVAIPDMTGSLGLSASGRQWVIDAYTLTFGGLLLLGGRLSDLVGHRRMFLVGAGVFTLFSLLCGLAANQAMIEWFRVGQGIGGAILAPTSLCLLTTAFVEPAARHRAIGLWSAVSAAGAAAGVLVGGLLTSVAGWRWVFFINVPVGVGIILVAAIGIHLPRTTVPARLDVAGALLATGGLALVLVGLIGVNERGWTSAATIGLLAVGIAVLVAFLVHEGRFARDPLLPLGLFADRGRASALALFAIIGAVVFFLYFDVSLHLQRVDGDSPLQAGLSFLPVALATTLAATNGRRMLALLGARNQLVVGMLLATAGFVWLSFLGVQGGYWASVGLPMVLIGLGMGSCFVPVTVAATADVPAELSGAASGLVNTSRQVGGAIGLAALATVASAGLGPQPALAAVAAGDQRALLVCAALTLVGAAVAPLIAPLGRTVTRYGRASERTRQHA